MSRAIDRKRKKLFKQEYDLRICRRLEFILETFKFFPETYTDEQKIAFIESFRDFVVALGMESAVYAACYAAHLLTESPAEYGEYEDLLVKRVIGHDFGELCNAIRMEGVISSTAGGKK